MLGAREIKENTYAKDEGKTHSNRRDDTPKGIQG
jgi:hypothetical protein